MSDQVKLIIALLDMGARVINHNGKVVKVGGRKFPAVHLKTATHHRYLRRQDERMRRKARE